MTPDESRPQLWAPDTIEGPPQPFDDAAYASSMMSPSKNNGQIARLYETFTRYFGPVTDAGGAPLAFTLQQVPHFRRPA